MDQRLIQAAETGDVNALFALIEENPSVLDAMDQIPFVDTPLHIAAAAGHIKFALQVMNLKPSFARKLNKSLFSPMHLALLNGHTEMAVWLLKFDKDLVRVKGRDGNTPLHCVVELGNIETLVEFLTVCPECIKDVNFSGQNALHIAIIANKFPTLQILVGWLQRYYHEEAENWENELFNWKDIKGNTILHIAAYKNDHQTLKLILASSRSIKKNIKNSDGLAVVDILKRGELRQMENRETQNILRLVDSCTASSLDDTKKLCEHLKSNVSWGGKLSIRIFRERLKITNEMSNAMLVVAALVITIAFQGVLTPPGGVWQASFDNNNKTSLSQCNTTYDCDIRSNTNHDSTVIPQRSPGVSIMDKGTFTAYWVLNTLALVSAFGLTIYLLPPGYVAHLFVSVLSWLLSCYWTMVSIILPSSSPVFMIIMVISFTSMHAFLSIYLTFYYKIDKGKSVILLGKRRER